MEETKPTCPTCGGTLIDLRTQDLPNAGWCCGQFSHWFASLPEQPAEESFPLISVITPTRNRRRFIPRLLSDFLAQDYPNKELLIVADGEDIEDLLPPGNGYVSYVEPGCECSIFHLRHESARLNTAARIAEALNLGIRAARGACCVRFDDDDWQSPARLMQQVALLSMSGKAVLAGSSGLFLTESGAAFEYTGSPWQASGFSHAFTRAYALEHPYPEDAPAEVGEDLAFIAEAYRLGELCTVSGMDWVVARDHAAGTSGGRFSGPGQGANDPAFQMIDGEVVFNLRKSDNWRRVPFERIAAIVPPLSQTQRRN